MAKPTITQMDLVARLNLQDFKIDQSGLSKIESGVRPVTDIEVVKLAKALRVSVSWLLGETENDDVNKPNVINKPHRNI